MHDTRDLRRGTPECPYILEVVMEHIAWAVGAALLAAVLGVALINGLFELVRAIGATKASRPTRRAA